MNLTTLISDVRSRLDEDTEGYWTDTMITRWLNEGNRDVAYRMENLEATETSNIVANQHNYSLPSDYLKIKRVTADSHPLSYIDFPRLNAYESKGTASTATTGNPEVYYLWNDEINLYPTPSAGVTNGLVISYYKSPATLADGADTPDNPEQLHYLLVLYACEVGLRRDTLDAAADRYLRRYMEGLAQATRYYAVPQRTGCTQIQYIEE